MTNRLDQRFFLVCVQHSHMVVELSGRVFDLRLMGCRHHKHSVVSLSKTLYPLLSTGSTQEVHD